MSESSLRRNTGIFGLVATLISLIQLPLYFMYDGAPPQWDILTRVMVSIITGRNLRLVQGAAIESLSIDQRRHS